MLGSKRPILEGRWEGSPVANERLRTAMGNARIDIDQIAEATKVDPKTVQRWLAGRVPHPRHRWKVSELVGQEEAYLWPTARSDVAPGAPATTEVVTAYAHRADIPASVWNDLTARIQRLKLRPPYSPPSQAGETGAPRHGIMRSVSLP